MFSKKNLSRFLSILMAVIFVVSMMPAPALADATDPSVVDQTSGDHDDLYYKGNGTGSASDFHALLEKYAAYVPTGSTVGANKFDLTLKVTGNTISETVTPPATITLFVIDVSASMTNNSSTKLQKTKDAATGLVDIVTNNSGGEDYFGLITYSDNAGVVSNFTKNTTTIKSNINGLTTSGYTNINGALIAAYKMLENPQNYGMTGWTAEQLAAAKVNLVFLSDGEANRYYRYRLNANDNSWNIFDIKSEIDSYISLPTTGTGRRNLVRAGNVPADDTDRWGNVTTSYFGTTGSESTAFAPANAIASLIHSELGYLDFAYSVFLGTLANTTTGINSRELMNNIATNSFFQVPENNADLERLFAGIASSITTRDTIAGSNANPAIIQDTLADGFSVNGNVTATIFRDGVAVNVRTEDVYIRTNYANDAAWDAAINNAIVSIRRDFITVNGNVIRLYLLDGLGKDEHATLNIPTVTNKTGDSIPTNVGGSDSSLEYSNQTGDGYKVPFAIPKVKIPQSLADLKIEKAIVGAYGVAIPTADAEKDFTFAVTIGGSAATGTYSVYNKSDDSVVATNRAIGAGGIITLKGGQYAVIARLLRTATYSVTEVAASIPAGYVLSGSSNTSGTIGAGATASFTNTFYKTAQLTVGKNVVASYNINIPDGTFTFGLYRESDDVQVGSDISVTVTAGTFGSTVVNIPIISLVGHFDASNNAALYIKEKSAPNTDWEIDPTEYPVTVNANGTVTWGTTSGGNPVYPTNNYVPKTTFELSKNVIDDQIGDAGGKKFTFVITFGNTANPLRNADRDAITYTVSNAVSGVLSTGTLSSTNHPLTVQLGDDDSIKFFNVPVGIAYSVVESNLGDFVNTGWTGNTAKGFVTLAKAIEAENTRAENDITLEKIVIGGPTSPRPEFSVAGPKGPYTVYDGYSELIEDLKVGDTYKFEEGTNTAYWTTVSVDGGAEQNSNIANVTLTAGETHSVVFTNTYKVGSLAVSKIVDTDGGNEGALTATYKVKVEFSGSGYLEGITVNGKTLAAHKLVLGGEGTDVDGSIVTFNIIDGDTVDLENIPYGTTYTVEETDKGGAVVTYNGNDSASGTINETTFEVSIVITNSFDTPTSGLTVTKKVVTTVDSPDGKNGPFLFEIKLWTETVIPAVEEVVDPISGDVITPGADAYTVNTPVVLDDPMDKYGVKLDDDNPVPGTYYFSLLHNESKTFADLDDGTFFEVTEVGTSGARATFLRTVNATRVSNYKASGKIVWDLEENKGIKVLFINNFVVNHGKLTVGKRVVDPAGLEDADAEYGFTVRFVAPNFGLSTAIDAIIPSIPDTAYTYENGLYTFVLKRGEVAYFRNIPAGIKYIVTETDSGYADSVLVNGAEVSNNSVEGTFVKNSSGWKVENQKVKVTNKYAPNTTETDKSNDKYDEDTNPDGFIPRGETTIVTYTIDVTNTSNNNSGKNDVVLTRVIDNKFSEAMTDSIKIIYAPLDGNGEVQDTTFTMNGNVLTFTNGILLLHTNDKVTIEYKVEYTPASSGTITNKVLSISKHGEYKIKSRDESDVPVYSGDGSSIDIVKQVSKDTDPNDFKDHEDFKYRDVAIFKVVIENTGRDDFSSLVLEDTYFKDIAANMALGKLHADYDDDKEIMSVTDKNGNLIDYFFRADGNGNLNTMVFGEYNNGVTTYETFSTGDTITILYRFPVTATETPDVNTATATAIVDGEEETDTDTASVQAETPEISVDKAAVTGRDGEDNPINAPIKVGQVANYTITIENKYDETLVLERVIDSMFVHNSAQYEFVGDIEAYNVTQGYAYVIEKTFIDGVATWIEFPMVDDDSDPTTPDVPQTFEPGDVVTVTYTLKFMVEGTYPNTAEGVATFRGLEAVDKDDDDNTATVEVNGPDFNLSKMVARRGTNNFQPSISNQGSINVTYRVIIANDTDVEIFNVTLKDPILTDAGKSATITEILFDDGTGDVALVEDTDYEIDGDTIKFFDSLAPGNVITIYYDATIASSYKNTATLNGDTRANDNEPTPLKEINKSANVTITSGGGGDDPGSVRLMLSKSLVDETGSSTGNGRTFTVNVYDANRNLVQKVTISANGSSVYVSGAKAGNTYYIAEELSDSFTLLGYTVDGTSSGGSEVRVSLPAERDGVSQTVNVVVNNQVSGGGGGGGGGTVDGDPEVLGEKDEDPDVLGDKDIVDAGGITTNMIVMALGLLIALFGVFVSIFVKRRARASR